MRDLLRYVGWELRRRPYTVGFLLALAALGVWTVLPLPKRAIRRTVRRCERTIEAQDAAAMRLLLADEFYSPHTGDLTETLEWLHEVFDTTDDVQIRIKEMEISAEGAKARAVVHFSISVTFTHPEVGRVMIRGLTDPASVSGRLEQCEMEFSRGGDGLWRVTRARLVEGGPPDADRPG